MITKSIKDDCLIAISLPEINTKLKEKKDQTRLEINILFIVLSIRALNMQIHVVHLLGHVRSFSVSSDL